MGTFLKDSRGKFRPHYDIYDIYINGTKCYRKYGIKSAIAFAEKCTGDLFGERRIDVVDVATGEIKCSM